MRHGPLAQLVEQGTLNPKVIGSTPIRPTMTLIRPAPASPSSGLINTQKAPDDSSRSRQGLYSYPMLAGNPHQLPWAVARNSSVLPTSLVASETTIVVSTAIGTL